MAFALNKNRLQEDTVKISRKYVNFHLISSRTVLISETYHMWMPSTIDILIYRLPSFLPNLEAKSSNGNDLHILSNNNLIALLATCPQTIVDFFENSDENQPILKELGKERMDENVSSSSEGKQKRSHYVGIILPKSSSDHYEKIDIKWIEQIEVNKKQYCLSKSVNLSYEFTLDGADSNYFDITLIDDKYEIQGKPSVSPIKQKRNAIEVNNKINQKKILDDNKRCIFWFGKNDLNTIKITWLVGIPVLVKRWVWAGFLASIFVLFFSLVSFTISHTTFSFTSYMLAGLIGIILGFRLLLFHDIELMSRWNTLYLIMLGITFTVTVSLFFLQLQK